MKPRQMESCSIIIIKCVQQGGKKEIVFEVFVCMNEKKDSFFNQKSVFVRVSDNEYLLNKRCPTQDNLDKIILRNERRGESRHKKL
jgi:hypothetical protein